MKIGSRYRRGECRFSVWAPSADGLSLRIVHPRASTHPMSPLGREYWGVSVPGAGPGTRYFYEIRGQLRPDPASDFQPEGVLGPSEVVDHSAFSWTDCGWKGFSLRDALIYELHIGTFTPEGTFAAVIPRLDELRRLGVTAVELMPVAQFSGTRNWGYDGTFLFAPQNSYGGPRGLKELVNACHSRQIAVILDVVLNHLGPEGNFLGEFGPYFTNRCSTPWGMGVNFDGRHADAVRNFCIRAAESWILHYHVDGLRLDAIQHIYDAGARHILAELSARTRRLSRMLKRRVALIAESDLNDTRVLVSRSQGGYGLDGQWLDDFHHSVHTLLTGETAGYYMDYGRVSHLAKALTEGFVYSWVYSSFRHRHYGSSSAGVPSSRFVVYNQNHDQIGNRLFGERLTKLVPFEAVKLAAGILFVSPYIPMLFMGEEYAEEAPFQYFVDHSDEALVRAVAEGRKNEFRSFVWKEQPPEPQSLETFERSKIDWGLRDRGRHRIAREYYGRLIRMKNMLDPQRDADRRNMRVLHVDEDEKTLAVCRGAQGRFTVFCANFSDKQRVLRFASPCGTGLRLFIDSADTAWQGPGSICSDELGAAAEVACRPYGFIVYTSEF